MDAVKKDKKELKLRVNRNSSGSSRMHEEQVPSHNREVSQRHGFIDDPILILDSDDSSNQSSVQVIHLKYFQPISGICCG